MKLLAEYLIFIIVLSCSITSAGFSQFPPPAGQIGSTAIYCDSSILIGWAKSCTVNRGYINVADTDEYYGGSNRASYGNEYMTSDKADNFVLSLGDGGSATLSFENPISNGPGFDFAVFENSFGDEFLELAFVEASSDGIRFVRFPSVSLTQSDVQTSTFGTIDATKIHNLAGKYRVLFGTPFDLDDLKDSVNIDLNHIVKIRVIDVVGCIQNEFATRDASGNIINDPWPTPFNTGGFDLDAIGVIHFASQGVNDSQPLLNIQVFPNPVSDWLTIHVSDHHILNLNILDLSGRILQQLPIEQHSKIDLKSYPQGIYLLHFSTPEGQVIFRKFSKL